MPEQITIQKIWSPPGKEFPKVFTTPEQTKFHLYEDQAGLKDYFRLGAVVNLDAFDTTNQQGKPIRRIRNVFVDNKPVIPQEGKSLVEEAVKIGAVVTSSTDDTRLRSMAISYSKDLAVAGKIELKDVTKYANKFLNYILNIKGKEE